MTTCPCSSAGRITRSTRSARAARNRNSSAPKARSCRDFSASFRAASAIGVPPGSRTGTTRRCSAWRRATSHFTSVDFPAPSGPSITTKNPESRTPPPKPRSLAKRDDGTRGALLDALVNPGINPGHELLEIRLGRDHLLVHRIRLHTLERAIVLLDLLLGRFLPLLRDALDLLREPLRLREHLLDCLILAQRFRRAAQRLVLVGLAEQPSQFFCLLLEH